MNALYARRYCSLTLLLALQILPSAFAQPETPLEDQLKYLNLPENQAPSGVSTEKLYSVQSRFSPLARRLEFSVSGGHDLTNSAFLSSQQLGAGVRYHFNDRWSAALQASSVLNAFTGTAQQLQAFEGIRPDVAYARMRWDASIAFNTLYGKFRLNPDQVFYLDQYVALGAGRVSLDGPAGPQSSTMGVVDLGFAFWLGRSGVVRLGIKDHIYREQRVLSSAWTQHWVGHLDIGWMTGGGAPGGRQ